MASSVAPHAVVGLDQAMERLASIEVGSGALEQAAVAECVLWVAAIDEALGGKEQASPYSAARDAARVTDLMRGIRYARNQAAHELIEVADVSSGRAYPKRSPLTYRERIWSSDPALPLGQRPPQRAAYFDELAGRRVSDVLDQARLWLDSQIGTNP